MPSLGLLGVAYVGCDKVAAQLLLAIPGAFGGATYAGNQMNHIALSPKYAGTMYGITNAASNMCGFLAPYVIGLLINGRVRTSTFYILRILEHFLLGDVRTMENGVLLSSWYKHRCEFILRSLRQR